MIACSLTPLTRKLCKLTLLTSINLADQYYLHDDRDLCIIHAIFKQLNYSKPNSQLTRRTNESAIYKNNT